MDHKAISMRIEKLKADRICKFNDLIEIGEN